MHVLSRSSPLCDVTWFGDRAVDNDDALTQFHLVPCQSPQLGNADAAEKEKAQRRQADCDQAPCLRAGCIARL